MYSNFPKSLLCIPEQMCLNNSGLSSAKEDVWTRFPASTLFTSIGHRRHVPSQSRERQQHVAPSSRPSQSAATCLDHCVQDIVFNEGVKSASSAVCLVSRVGWGCFGLACAVVLMLSYADLINCAGLRPIKNTRQQAPM